MFFISYNILVIRFDYKFQPGADSDIVKLVAWLRRKYYAKKVYTISVTKNKSNTGWSTYL